MSENDYQQALDYLYSFVNYSLKHASELARAEFNLERMRQLMHLLGDPQEAWPAIHIAGTKGKGSTAALIAHAYRAAGYRAGLYTSPHLEDFAERIQVDGQPVPHDDLAELVETLKPAADQVPFITTFELTTALAFLYFARQKVDVGVIEVGLGGRLDATNIITPRVSVITALSLDHTAVLGDTLEEIAAEKGGIIKPGRPLVSAPQKPAAAAVLTRLAAERHAPLTRVGEDLRFQPLSHTLSGQDFSVQWRDEAPQPLHIPLLGAHQVENAATAYAALRVAAAEGLPIQPEAIVRGFAAARWPGRFEIISRQPTVILDGAHNEEAAIRLAETLRDYLPGQKAILLFGVSEDKDARAMLQHLTPYLERVIFSRAEHPRAEKAAVLLQRYGPDLPVPAEALEPAEAAVQRALALAANQPDLFVLSAGSLFLTAAVRTILTSKNQG